MMDGVVIGNATTELPKSAVGTTAFNVAGAVHVAAGLVMERDVLTDAQTTESNGMLHRVSGGAWYDSEVERVHFTEDGSAEVEPPQPWLPPVEISLAICIVFLLVCLLMLNLSRRRLLRYLSSLVPAASPIERPTSQWAHHVDDQLTSARVSLECPITCERFRDPVYAPDGHTYEREAIRAWLRSHGSSPMTGEAMPAGELVTNWLIKGALPDADTTRAPGRAVHEKVVKAGGTYMRWQQAGKLVVAFTGTALLIMSLTFTWGSEQCPQGIKWQMVLLLLATGAVCTVQIVKWAKPLLLSGVGLTLGSPFAIMSVTFVGIFVGEPAISTACSFCGWPPAFRAPPSHQGLLNHRGFLHQAELCTAKTAFSMYGSWAVFILMFCAAFFQGVCIALRRPSFTSQMGWLCIWMPQYWYGNVLVWERVEWLHHNMFVEPSTRLEGQVATCKPFMCTTYSISILAGYLWATHNRISISTACVMEDATRAS
uniref:U-box domain-containing protein n=1 Tax=Haptolina brevifila TaxID=156173 RepID=A0A7S2IQ25_9EUKA|mmetsp:Transcript_69667/g.138127  ORF Transcript_69667/g.138127 Transcript_69667/m.138127 type:complete len:484 (+) Transcript_69667:950-2401(+)